MKQLVEETKYKLKSTRAFERAFKLVLRSMRNRKPVLKFLLFTVSQMQMPALAAIVTVLIFIC